MSVAHKKRENLATFHALHRSAIGIDVHSNLIVQPIRTVSTAVAVYSMRTGNHEHQNLNLMLLHRGARQKELKFLSWNPQVFTGNLYMRLWKT